MEEMEEEEGDDDVLDFEYEFDDDDDDGADYDLSWRKFSEYYSPPYIDCLVSVLLLEYPCNNCRYCQANVLNDFIIVC